MFKWQIYRFPFQIDFSYKWSLVLGHKRNPFNMDHIPKYQWSFFFKMKYFHQQARCYASPAWMQQPSMTSIYIISLLYKASDNKNRCEIASINFKVTLAAIFMEWLIKRSLTLRVTHYEFIIWGYQMWIILEMEFDSEETKDNSIEWRLVCSIEEYYDFLSFFCNVQRFDGINKWQVMTQENKYPNHTGW